jgi:UDP-N-acetylmuramate dehydrogenase
MDIEQDYSLQYFNTLRLPVRARYFISVDTIDSLREAIAFTRDRDLPMIVLGGGSNVVLRDPYPGCVMHVQLLGETVLEETDESVCLRVAAGEAWHSLVMRCHERGWYGLENLALIPGTVGAAPIQNIGAYGVEVSEFLSEVEVIERATGKRRVLTNAECGFGYRHSRFKDSWAERFVVTSITLKILPRAEPRTDYPALRAELESAGGRLRARDVLDAIIGIRRQKLPDPARLPNAGSFFKNPVVDATQFDVLRSRYPGIVHWSFEGQFKLAAAWLVEQAGWKGYRQGDVGVHANQALVLVNYGAARADDVLALAERIQASVLERFGIHLELEPTVY